MTINDTKFNIALANSGLTIAEAAKRAGLSRARFAMILNQKKATPQAVGKIAKGLGCNVTEIIETEE
ncbi:MAG: helix-turn-helix domain-containing protein [Ruminococcus sp.]|jgi:lambda repressor-like predicted transcriptional regulator